MFYNMTDKIVPEGAVLMGNNTSYMLRARQTGSFFSLAQLKGLRDIVAQYGEKRLRIAARQNFQLYAIQEEDIDTVKAKLAEINMPAVGNFSDIAMNPDSGLRADEAFDVWPYAQALGKWRMNSEAAKNMPGKFKMNLSSTQLDNGNACYGDFTAFAFVEEGKRYFRIYGGGSLGAMPRLATCLDEKMPAEEFLVAAEAIAIVFADLFKDATMAKKRMRFKLRELTDEDFIARYQAAKAGIDASALRVTVDEASTKLRPWAGGVAPNHPNVRPTKEAGIVSLRLHTIDGMISINQLNDLITTIESLGHEVELALDSAHGIWLRDIASGEVEGVLSAIASSWGDQYQPTLVNCRGKGICRFGLAATRPVIDALKQYDTTQLPTVHVSGCMNSCGRHQIAALGFWGKVVMNAPEDVFNVVVGGRLQEGGGARMAVSVGDIAISDVPAFMEALMALKAQDITADWSDFLYNQQEAVAALLKKAE